MGSAEEKTMVMAPVAKEQGGWFRRPRPPEELRLDPNLLFQVGHLTGAALMASSILSLRDDEELKKVGARLDQVVSWFFEEVKN